MINRFYYPFTLQLYKIFPDDIRDHIDICIGLYAWCRWRKMDDSAPWHRLDIWEPRLRTLLLLLGGGHRGQQEAQL